MLMATFSELFTYLLTSIATECMQLDSLVLRSSSKNRS